MTRLEHFLAYAESHRGTLTAAAVSLILLIAGIDWALPKITVGYLYLIPILLSAAALNRAQILTMAILCAYLREVFDPGRMRPWSPARVLCRPSTRVTGRKDRAAGWWWWRWDLP